MRITDLELENIKSYGERTRIELTPGLNAICGANGSGKTTILEAIGYVLFDFLPYNQNAFRREGERTGTMRVGLIARDEREYEVVRKIGSGSQYFVADRETGARLAERREDVLDWIRRQALDIDADIDLAALFKNAVGVPQGTMTSDFGGSPATRKSIFDPLLRVEEYRDAFEYLLETQRFLRERMAQVGEEIARLEGEAERIPPTEDQYRALEADVRQSEASVARLVAEIGTLEAQRAELDRVESRAQELQERIQGLVYDIRRTGDLLRVRQEELARSEKARLAAEESREGHERVIVARRALSSMEGDRRARDELRVALAATTARRTEIFAAIERLDIEVRESHEAAASAESLGPRVAEQELLETALREAGERLDDRSELAAKRASVDREIAELEESCARRQARLDDATCAENEAAALRGAPDELAVIQSELGRLLPLREEAEAIRAQGAQLKARRTALGREVVRAEEVRRALDALLPLTQGLQDFAQLDVDLRAERAGIGAAADYQQLARRHLQRHECPLLETRCPLIAEDETMLQRFDAREAALARRAKELDRELEAVEQEIARARSAAEEARGFEVQLAHLSRSQSQLDEVEASLREYADRYTRLTAALRDEESLRSRQADLAVAVTRLHEAERLAAEIPLLSERLEHDVATLKRLQSERASLQSRLEDLQAVEHRLAEVTGALEALENPRGERDRLRVVAARHENLLARLAVEERRLKDESGRVNALSAQLAPFEELDEAIEQSRREESAHLAEYERFLDSRSDADALPARQAATAEATRALAEAEAARETVEKERITILAGYDAEEHARLKGACDAVQREIVAESTRREHRLERLGQVDRELAKLRRQAVRLERKTADRDAVVRTLNALTFIRDTIRAAGPAVTESLLTHISGGAGDIYAEIMDDHASELRWDRDYEIKVQKGADERTFAQLSGGEQMSAALAVRLGLLKEMSEVDFAFFDEPTQNMDGERRSNLANQIGAVRGFEQLMVISHDDTFDHHTENLVRLRKEHDTTAVQTS